MLQWTHRTPYNFEFKLYNLSIVKVYCKKHFTKAEYYLDKNIGTFVTIPFQNVDFCMISALFF